MKKIEEGFITSDVSDLVLPPPFTGPARKTGENDAFGFGEYIRLAIIYYKKYGNII